MIKASAQSGTAADTSGARSRRRALLAALGCAAVLAAGCTTPPPPPVAPEVTRTSGQPVITNELTIGVDELDAGFNPHTLADVGPVSLAIGGLVLPSVFRPDGDGVLQLDKTVATSAEITAQQPFTVSYRLRQEASWSDGAPIAAEDFAYLADRMRAEPGVVGAAGYRLIRQVSSGAGGKQVNVVFDRPYPGWRTLFSNLLPAHLFKDAPGGWAQVLENGIPVSGGPFAVTAIDEGRGLVVLERNDRYWELPAVPDRLVLRRADPANVVNALATGGDQLAVLRADAITMALLRERAGQLPERVVPEPMAAELLLRPASSALADPAVRQAVAAALDQSDLVALGTGNGPAATLPAQARTLLPSQPGYTPTRPAASTASRADPAEVTRLLRAAGYVRVDDQWLRDGHPLTLLVAAPAERSGYVTVATRVVRQLRAAGIDAQLATPTGDELFATFTAPPAARRTAEPTATSAGAPAETATETPTATTPPSPATQAVDIAVVPRPVTGDPAADLVSWYGCTSAGAGASTDAVPTAAPDGATVTARAPENPAGYCNEALQAAMTDALSGATAVGDTIRAVEPVLWRDLPSIPLFQHALLLVTGQAVRNVEPGTLLDGPFGGASRWVRNIR